MARDFSPEYIEKLKFPNLATMHCLIRVRRLLSVVRSVQRTVKPDSSAFYEDISQWHGRELITSSLEAESQHFRSRRWAFVNKILDESFHRKLVSQWPRRKFLDPPADLLKSYDRGFEWSREQPGAQPLYIELHPAFKLFLDYLRSDSFSRRISIFAGGQYALSCYSYRVTSTWPGSVVAPHRDTVAFLPEGKHFVNIVFYIDGSGGPGSGGLSLLKDNNFREIIFESLELHNTALIYDVSAPFYHGFRPVERGKFRWAIIANFCAADYRIDNQGRTV